MAPSFFAASSGDVRRHSAMSIAGGFLLLVQPKLALGALAVLLGLSFGIDGLGKAVAAVRGRDVQRRDALLFDGLFRGHLGLHRR